MPFFVCVLTSLQITSYILSLGSGSGQDYQILYRGPKRTFEAKKLDDGETYSVRVQAVSSYGESEPSTVLTVRTRSKAEIEEEEKKKREVKEKKREVGGRASARASA